MYITEARWYITEARWQYITEARWQCILLRPGGSVYY